MAFPTDLDDFTPKVDDSDDVMAVDVNELQTAIESLEAKVGADSSLVATSHDYKIAALETDMGTAQGDISNLQSGKLANVVEDTTPQLGGDLDANTHKITGGTIITGQTEKTAPLLADIALIVDTADSNALKKSTLANLLALTGYVDGWIPAGETWTYASTTTYAHTGTNTAYACTFTISGDKTSKYYPGQRIKFTQSTGGTKMGIIHKVAYSDPNTTITAFLGTDYTIANEAITSPFYSVVRYPAGFSPDENDWCISYTDTGQRQLSTSTAYASPTNHYLDIPLGEWKTSFHVYLWAYGGSGPTNVAALEARCALSTANNSVSDVELLGGNSWKSSTSGVTAHSIYNTIRREKKLTLTEDDTYYFVGAIISGGVAYTRGDQMSTKLLAVDAYL